MNWKIILFTLFTINSAFGSVECYYRFTDSIIEITPEMRINGCTADFIWGSENVCFRGSVKNLVKKINSEYYTWGSSLRVRDALALSSDLVEFTGVDAQSFFSARQTISRCQD